MLANHFTKEELEKLFLLAFSLPCNKVHQDTSWRIKLSSVHPITKVGMYIHLEEEGIQFYTVDFGRNKYHGTHFIVNNDALLYYASLLEKYKTILPLPRVVSVSMDKNNWFTRVLVKEGKNCMPFNTVEDYNAISQVEKASIKPFTWAYLKEIS